MRKSTLFISTVLTIFIMATIFGVVSAYQQIVKNQAAIAATSAPIAQAAPVVEPVSVEPASIPTLTTITPEQATTIATTFLNDQNVYSVETVDYQGAVAYLITFSSGKLVYVSTSGDILAVSEIPPVIVANTRRGNSNGGNTTGSVPSTTGGGEHEGSEGGDD